MVADFPHAIKAFDVRTDGIDDVLATDINQAYSEIESIEAWLYKNLSQGMMLNGRLSVTATSDGLTVGLHTLAGIDPTSDDPIIARIGDAVHSISATLSVTLANGTNWFNSGRAELAAQEVDYFPYLGYNDTNGVVIGPARIPYANRYDDFSTSDDSEKHCEISNTSDATSSDYYEVIGRFAATLSCSSDGYVWTVPTFTAKNLINRPIYETRVLTWALQPTNLTISDGTIYPCIYHVSGRKLLINASINFGASTSVSGVIGITFPFTLKNAQVPLHTGFFADSSPGVYYIGMLAQGNLHAMKTDGAYAILELTSSTVPFTWAVNDKILIDVEDLIN